MKIGDLIKLKKQYSDGTPRFITKELAQRMGVVISSYVFDYVTYFNVLCNDNSIAIFTQQQLKCYYELA
jgi:hypothetical protein